MSDAGLVLRHDRGTLVLDGLEALPADRQRLCLDLIAPFGVAPDERIGQRPRGPGIAYRAVVTALKKNGFALTDEARNYDDLNLTSRRVQRPHPHQQEALDAWRAQFRRGVVVLPTGAGKSFVAELAIAETQRSTLVVAPTIDLMNQWATNLELAFADPPNPAPPSDATASHAPSTPPVPIGPPVPIAPTNPIIGLLGGGHNRLGPITVTTYDSAHIHLERLADRFGLVIFDECHHLPSPAYAQSALGLIAPFRLGLTATPERGDGTDSRLLDLIGPIVYRRDIQDLEGDYLASYEVIRLRATLDEDERARYETARKTYRDFVERHRISMSQPNGWGRFLAMCARSEDGRAAHLAWREQRNIALRPKNKLELLESLLLRHKEDPLIIFCADNTIVLQISKTWLIPSLTQHTPGPERKRLLEDFNGGRLSALVTARVLNEGVDLPSARVGIVLAGSATVSEHVQRLGRLLRKRGDKRAILYEIVTAQTGEESISDRRRDHGAYRR